MRIPINYLIYLIDTKYKNLFEIGFEDGDISEYSNEEIVISDRNKFIPYNVYFSNEIIFYKLKSNLIHFQFRFLLKGQNKFLYISKSISNYRYNVLFLSGYDTGHILTFIDYEIQEVDLGYELLSEASEFYDIECPLLDKLLK
mgnify:FL=1